MDGVDGDDSAFAKAPESGEDYGSAGGEGDGAVESDGRLVVFFADPECACRSGLLAVVFAAGGDEDLAVPVTEDLNGLACGGSEAEETDALAWLGARYAKAAETDDSGAEKWGDVGVVEGFGERVNEVGAGESVLGVASVDGVAGKGGAVAEVFFVAATEGAGAVGAADPGDADASAGGEIESFAFEDLADDLVAEDERLVDEREVAFEDMEVGAADSAGGDAEESVAFAERGDRDVLKPEGLVRAMEDGGFHGFLKCARMRMYRAIWLWITYRSVYLDARRRGRACDGSERLRF